MILVTHGIIGAAIGRLIPGYPLAAFAGGLISHFLMDAVPHWHYPLLSAVRDTKDPLQYDMVIGKRFLFDLVSMGLDFAAGIILSVLFFQGWAGFGSVSPWVLFGALGGMLPDASHFLYMKLRREPFYSLERFHIWAHSKKDIDHRYLLGIGSQALIILAAVLLSRAL